MVIVPVAESGDPRLCDYLSLTNRQLRRSVEARHGLFIAESTLVVEKALDEGYAPRSLLIARRRLEALEPLLARLPEATPVFSLDDGDIEAIAGYRVHRGVLGAFERKAPRDASYVLAHARNVVVLEGSVDATNVGAIFRSAAALGADAVLLDPTCADPYERRCLRVSMGCVLSVPWTRLSAWPEGAIDDLRRRGFTVASCALGEKSRELDAFAKVWRERRSEDPLCRLALVFGTEGEGLASRTVAASDVCIRIPMARHVDSLNVGAAAAIFLYELFGRADTH